MLAKRSVILAERAGAREAKLGVSLIPDLYHVGMRAPHLGLNVIVFDSKDHNAIFFKIPDPAFVRWLTRIFSEKMRGKKFEKWIVAALRQKA